MVAIESASEDIEEWLRQSLDKSTTDGDCEQI